MSDDALSRTQRAAVSKIANIERHGAKPHDFEGVRRELAGESTGFDHVTEMRNNAIGLQSACESIQGSLRNTKLDETVRLELESALKRASVLLCRMRIALTGGAK